MTLRSPRLLFTFTALTVAAICVAIVRSAIFNVNPDVAAWGVTFDLTISIPLIYYFVLVRPRLVAPLTIIPLFVVCMYVAARIVPAPQQGFLQQLRFIAAPLDLITIWLIVRRAAALRRRGVRDDDPIARFRTVATHLFGNERVGEAVAYEVATFWYAIFGWRRERPRDGFTFHERNGWGSILACILVLLVAESVGLHLFVQMWSRRAAWIVTTLDLYGIVWLLGDYHALRLRTTTIDDEALELRYGIRWNVRIDRANIAAVEAITSEAQWKKRKGVLKVAILDEPRILVTLREPAIAHGIAGITKRIDAIALLPDDVDGFVSAFQNT